ncbi:ABC transporter ATP-binding protein [Polynucleobacter sp. MWH-Aus1W21]|uniref:ABC transporter ATP-binding protein n=1 Tax=Polynucleobacter sp. MWH-Aus1W21 TaxID=1855880 RepID=UPI001BFDC74D|nr:ABC transporter ATP-binding protein [Polynucleobacter sp. MWH-Aus1W21]QWD66540.1 ABC transporter ATP-binding protein [Polynucleobacter sp. MWH-Aus1W21]
MNSLIVSGLGKAYKQYASRWSRLAEWVTPGHRSRHHLHWVLQDINFTLKPGEAMGIIGINGAGKSTLLKMIAGTIQPTLGEIQVFGKLAALLELGMGFHPDFTGRENALMAGQLLGHTAEEMRQVMPEILEFAEIGEYIDQPVRVYSSGMQMRLAFSVATAFRPDVLVVDEALSVGDAYFQHKSFERIRQYRALGTTLLIVSHDKAAIQSICDRAILINGGHLVHEGKPEDIMNYYNALLADKGRHEIEFNQTSSGQTQVVSGTGEASIQGVRLLDAQGNSVEVIGVGQSVELEVNIQINSDIPELVVGLLIKDRLGQDIFGTNTHHLNQVLYDLRSGENLAIAMTFPANLGVGSYSAAVALHSASNHIANNYEWRELAVIFSVVNMQYPEFIGSSWLNPALKITR